MQLKHAASGAWIAFALLGCGNASSNTAQPSRWSSIVESETAALMSVHGTAADDVWIAGADDGQGATALHWDGRAWTRLETGTRADLWWVNATEDGPVFFGGSRATLLRYDRGRFERIATPGLAKHTVFGVWAAASDDVYAVGSVSGRGGFIWHYDGTQVAEIGLPVALPVDGGGELPGLFKVWGLSADDVWTVGATDVVLRGNARNGFEVVRAGGSDTLFTVHGTGDAIVAVGGASSGVLLAGTRDHLEDHTPPSAPLLQGAFIDRSGSITAVGLGGRVYAGAAESLVPVETGLSFTLAESLHAVWVDPLGGVWSVGGNVLTTKLDHGIAIHQGAEVPILHLGPDAPPLATCPDAAIDPKPDGSIARRWNEQILNAIRRDVGRSEVQARNLFHFSVAVWDAWSAYDDAAVGFAVRERLTDADVDAARREAISYAAYRVLSRRYSKAAGGPVSQACFDAFMAKLGYDPNDASDTGTSARAFGNRVGRSILDRFADDGANEAGGYADPAAFEPPSPALVVDRPGTTAKDANVWQRLVLAKAETPNGIALGAGAQLYQGAHWGDVTPFALERIASGASYVDLGPPTMSLADAAVEIVRRSSELDSDDPTAIDVSPGAVGNNPVGTNDGIGFAENPATGQPYPAERVARSDYGRVLADFWTNGPGFETPPGQWNVIANQVSDRSDLQRRPFAEGPPIDPLAWDVRLYFALNGALHDAAIAAWEIKRKYVTSRPITVVRYMAARGQRSLPNAPSYDPEGLPVVEGLVEVITNESAAPGERHAHLARYVGEVALRAWRGEPGDRSSEVGGVAWIRGVDWVPHQLRTVVTPAHPGYVSEVSAFGRAAAVVLATMTGSDFFPGGYQGFGESPGALRVERGPTAPVRLGWATYFDAADQAGQSQLWGGVAITQDDLDGRRVGARVGEIAIAAARRHFDGSAAAK